MGAEIMAQLMSFEDIQRQVQEALKGLVPTQVPAFAKGVVEAPDKGWYRAEYYDALTGEKFSFYEAPAVVAIAFVREGFSRLVTAPTISIPQVEMATLPSITLPKIVLPQSPTIPVPTVTVAPFPEIEVPEVSIPSIPVTQYIMYCEGGAIFMEVCSPIAKTFNELSRAFLDAQNKVNLLIYNVNVGLTKTRQALLGITKGIKDEVGNIQVALNDFGVQIKTSVDSGLADLRDKTEVAVGQFRSNVEASVNATLKDYRDKTQAAFNAYRNNIQVSVNAGLSQFIPSLYDMMGLPPPEVSPEEAERLREMGDVNGDGVIDQRDLDLIKSAYGKRRGELGYVEAYDLNRDGYIDLRDTGIASANYGKKAVPTTQLLSPVQLRNVDRDGFEFWGLSEGMKLSYMAIGRR